MDKITKWTLGIIALLVVVLIVILVALPEDKPAAKTTTKKVTTPITLGFISPLTGDVASIGQMVQQSVALAVDEVNKEGGINGRPLRIIYEDGQCGPTEATKAAQKLVNIDRVPVIVGGLCSSETLAAAPIADGKTVLLSPCSSNPDITDAGDYVFRAYPSDSFQGKFAAEYAFENYGKKAAILYCNSDWCVGLKDVFGQRFKELGGQVVAVEAFEQNSRDLKTQLLKVKNANPGIVYMPSYTEATIVGLKQAKELGINMQFLGGDAWDDAKIYEGAGNAAEGIQFVVPDVPWPADFKQKMIAKTGKTDTPVCVPQAYDDVKMIANAMRKVGADPAKIKDELYKVQNYQGVSGTISFDENGDLKEATYVVKEVQDGKAVELR
ncbi:ABC transporter substrate-binding protein [Candidatus Woesearchaeota archaeon]|nr:ABC transporter substrate-binding protein [Candidatus Woesearchaeota archaeon]